MIGHSEGLSGSRALAAAWIISGVLVLCGGAAHAQSSRTQTQLPELEGIWFQTGDGCVPDGVTCPFVVEGLPLRARALGFREAFDEPLAPKYDCVPSVLPSLVADPYKFQIEQLEDRVVITYEKDDIVRTVWLEGHGHPRPRVGDFYQQGHSRGRYDDAQLIVVTEKFTFGPTGLDDMSNRPSSTSKRVTERYWRDGELMYAEVVTEDPLILSAPIVFTWAFELSDQPLYLPYGCDPDLSKEALEFLPPKYLDPGFVRIFVTPYRDNTTSRALMKRTTCSSLAIAAGCMLLAASPSQAHHAQRPFYDYGAWVEVEGTVRRFAFGNPHPVLYLEVTGPDGASVEWKLLFPPASVLRRRGWTSGHFVPGERITARGHPSRQPGTHGMANMTIVRADGSVAIGSDRSED